MCSAVTFKWLWKWWRVGVCVCVCALPPRCPHHLPTHWTLAGAAASSNTLLLRCMPPSAPPPCHQVATQTKVLNLFHNTKHKREKVLVGMSFFDEWFVKSLVKTWQDVDLRTTHRAVTHRDVMFLEGPYWHFSTEIQVFQEHSITQHCCNTV